MSLPEKVGGVEVADRFRVRFVSALLALYVGCVLLVTLTPSPVDKGVSVYIDRILQEFHERGLPGFFGYAEVEFLANVAMFVPVGFLAALVLPRNLWWVLLVLGPIASAVIEGMQLLFLPARYASVLDIVANSMGALAGAILAVAIRMLVNHRDRLLVDDLRTGRRSLTS